MKNKTVEKLMRFLITLLGAGIGAALAALILPLFSRWYPIESPYAPIALYAALCLVGAAVCFAFSSAIIGRTMKLIAAIERRWDAMPTQQIVLTSIGMIMGLVVAALITQLILSAGASLITISFSALTYVVLGYVGLRIGFHRYRGGKTPRMRRHLRRAAEAGILDDADLLMAEEGEDEEEGEAYHDGALVVEFHSVSSSWRYSAAMSEKIHVGWMPYWAMSASVPSPDRTKMLSMPALMPQATSV